MDKILPISKYGSGAQGEDDSQKIAERKMVGYCNYYRHRGVITRTIIKEHQCLGKECRWFVKCEEHPFWKERQIRKEKKLQVQAQAMEKEERLAEYRLSAIELAQSLQNPIFITCVQETAMDTFTVYFLSESISNDSKRYDYLITRMKETFHKRFLLERVRTQDGKLGTISDYVDRMNGKQK